MIVIDGDAIRIVELAWLVALLAELGHERKAFITREYLHSMIVVIDDHQETSMVIERQASRAQELTIGMAFLFGADRELDSSITIERILAHLFHFNVSLTMTKRYSQTQNFKAKRW